VEENLLEKRLWEKFGREKRSTGKEIIEKWSQGNKAMPRENVEKHSLSLIQRKWEGKRSARGNQGALRKRSALTQEENKTKTEGKGKARREVRREEDWKELSSLFFFGFLKRGQKTSLEVFAIVKEREAPNSTCKKKKPEEDL